MVSQRIGSLRIDERKTVSWHPVKAHARTVAMADLLADNHFILRSFPAAGPYDVLLSLPQERLRLEISSLAGEPLETIILPLRPLLPAIKKYRAVSEAYYATPTHADETREEDRPHTDNESASILQQLLAGQAEMDLATARRLFTLVCVLHLQD